MSNRRQGLFGNPYKSAQHQDGTGARNKEQARARDAYAVQDPYVDGDLPPFDPASGHAPGGMFAGEEAFAEEADARPEAEQAAQPAEPQLSLEELAGLCREHICPACPVKKEADDARLRALAEVDNARKRMEREREEHVRFAAEKVLSDILPALDNLDLALRHATPDKACKDFVLGVEMTRKLMLDSLRKHGLEMVGVVGQPFDPALHEAVGMTDDPHVADGEICVLLAPGYRLRERLLRPARVMVCRKGQE